MINERVCEGCGDCSVQSNCIAIEPIETDWGRKRRINQSSCNKDRSCLRGHCPSFVVGARRQPAQAESAARDAGGDALLPRAARAARCPTSTQPWNVLVTGIGGSGVVTVGALLGMAAHLEGKGVLGARRDRARAEERPRHEPRARRRAAGSARTPRASPRARPTS